MSLPGNPMERLRKRAEQALSAGETGQFQLDVESAHDLSALLHELRVYHAELEIQNSELIASQQAEESNRRRYQLLFMSLPLAAFVVDDRGIIEEANDIAAASFGFRTAGGMRQHSLLRLAGDDGAPALMSLLRPNSAADVAASVRVNFRTPSGNTLATETHIHPLPVKYHLDRRFLVLCVDRTPELQLADTRQLLDTLLENSSAAIYAFDTQGRCLLANRAVTALVGRDPETLVGLSREDIPPAEDATQHALNDQQVLLSRQPLIYEEKLHRPGQAARYFLSQKFPLFDAQGELIGVGGITTDISDSRNKDLQIELAAQIYRAGSEGIVITDAEQRVISVNAAFSQITGFEEDEVLGQKPSILASGRHPRAFYAEMWEDINTTGRWAGEVWNRRKSGEIYPEWLAISRVRSDHGATTNYIGVFSDVTHRKIAEDEIHRLAFYDPLTGLPNRHLLQDRAAQAIFNADRGNTGFAVIFLDLDRFKTINDVFGHTAGDQTLKEVTHRIRENVRENDTVSRFGGDEFVLLIAGMDGPALNRRANALIQAMVQPIPLGDNEVSISASLGVALYPEDGNTFEELLQKADMAMYQAKSAGRNGWRYFNENMARATAERLSVEVGLRSACAHGEMSLRFQPQVDLVSRRITGAEALLRWRRSDGFVPPDTFIPVAEETGVISELGRFVLEEAVSARKRWLEQGHTEFVIAVNVSFVQFWRNDFVAEVREVLAQHALPGELLEIELTERTTMKDPELAVQQMLALKALGVRLSIDDFGTGYSSLAYLNTMPIDALKIDQAFIRDIGLDSRDEAVCRTIIQLAQTIGLDTVAEGVEAPLQLAFLEHNGCTTGQGYLFDHPLLEPELTEQLFKLGDGAPVRRTFAE